MSVQKVLEELEKNKGLQSNIIARFRLPQRKGSYESIPDFLDERLKGLLKKKNIDRVYSHQAQALEMVQAGRDIVVVTPTASGKTLCYNLPVLNSILKNQEVRALYLFPTKALAQDQVAELIRWSEDLGGWIKTYTYDGDTPAEVRRSIRMAGSIVVTNPDMLHSGILPHHTKWMRLFENLEYVVIDELHTYRGVFGSHVANVLRRLHRICEFYGSQPRIICTSATIANPGQHGEKLTGRDMVVIDENGSPQGPRELIFYNPPVVNAALGIRRSSLLEAQKLAKEFIKAGVQTIVFARSRLQTEILITYLRRIFNKVGQEGEKIRGYRGGYLPRQRREIERDLRQGKIKGVVSTNALELGIDIGTLSGAILTGYPGTIASTWQQVGRAGRGSSLSIAVIVASSSPLDQFIINNPSYFLERATESALINPDNLVILISHIKCAAFELPFQEGEEFGAHPLEEILEYLTEKNILRKVQDRWFWMSEQYPADDISLRSASADNFVIIDKTKNARVIGEVDRFSAQMLIHEGAIYIHESKQYHIDRLDYDQEKAYAREVEVDYYTDANMAVDLKVLDVFASDKREQVNRAYGEVMVAARATVYKKIKFYSHENVGWGDINLPQEEMHTLAYWLSLPACRVQGKDKDLIQSALMGTANLLQNIAPLELMCDPGDIRVLAQVKSPFTGEPTIYLYERYPGGVGFSEKLFDCHDRLLQQVKQVLRDCSCPRGCPSCVGPMEEVGEKGKDNALWFLQEVMDSGA